MLHHVPYPRHIHPLVFIPAEVFHCQTDFGSDAYAVQILNQICLNIFTQKVPVRCITVRAFTKWYLVSIGIQGFYFVAFPFKSIELRNLKSILRKAFDLVKHNLTLLVPHYTIRPPFFLLMTQISNIDTSFSLSLSFFEWSLLDSINSFLYSSSSNSGSAKSAGISLFFFIHLLKDNG